MTGTVVGDRSAQAQPAALQSGTFHWSIAPVWRAFDRASGLSSMVDAGRQFALASESRSILGWVEGDMRNHFHIFFQCYAASERLLLFIFRGELHSAVDQGCVWPVAQAEFR